MKIPFTTQGLVLNRCQYRETPILDQFFLFHQFVFLRCTLTYLLSSLPFFLLIDARSRSGPAKSSWNRFAFTSENHSPVTNFFFFSSVMEPCILLKGSASITHQADLQHSASPELPLQNVHGFTSLTLQRIQRLFSAITRAKAALKHQLIYSLSEMVTAPFKHRLSPLPNVTNPNHSPGKEIFHLLGCPEG